MATPWVLVLNAGSSSLKFALLDPFTGQCLFDGIAERLLDVSAEIHIQHDGQRLSSAIPNGSVEASINLLMTHIPDDVHIHAIGHRVVHGGDRFQQAVIITDDILKQIHACTLLAPLHNPANLLGIDVARRLLPNLPQVAVFDTAFHSSLPEVAYRYAIPTELYQNFAIRRYGFHGTSHHFVALQAAKQLNKPLTAVQLISAHLGNGCSLCAIKSGESVDTTMGMTPLEGLVMGTRSGDIDPGIIFWLAEQNHMTVDAIADMLNKQSGLLGVSGLSNDLRTLEKAREEGNADAKLAIDLFVYKLAKSIAAMAVALDHIDALIFTGGIGENSALIRELVINKLPLMGFAIDQQKNLGANVSSIEANASVPILVIKTNEEWMIAQETYQQVEATLHD